MSVIQAIALDKPCRCIDYRFCSPGLQNPEGFYCRLHGEPVPAASSACPICGGVSPHSHTSEQISEHRVKTKGEAE